jgi:hypothetical protein
MGSHSLSRKGLGGGWNFSKSNTPTPLNPFLHKEGEAVDLAFEQNVKFQKSDFEKTGRSHAAADTHGHQPVAAATPFEFLNDADGKLCSRAPEGMA